MCFFPIVVTAGLAFVVCVLMTCSSLVHTALVPQAPSMSTQRGIIANADSRLREPGGPEQDRHESACAVCARRHWEEDLKPLLLFRDPCADELAQDVDHDCGKVHISQQSRLCRLLGVQRYAHRWPHIDVDELKASAVEHPFLKDEFLLLHKRRMPVDVTQPCDVCRDCRAALLSSVLTLPRFSLANDLWMGRQMQPLRNLAAGTRRLLPMIRACLQVTVLQPANLQKEERQRGFVGNSIFLPQAQPSAIRTTLPPPESDMQESILFVLVGQKKDTLASSALLSCPRDEYDAAVSCLQRSSPYYRNVELRHCSESPMQGCFVETSEDSYLARELLQKGPADAQGQDEESEKDETTQPAAHGSEHSAAEEDAGQVRCYLFFGWCFETLLARLLMLADFSDASGLGFCLVVLFLHVRLLPRPHAVHRRRLE